MLKNDLKIAWRTIRKQPFLSFLNTFGLAIGIAGGLLIALFVYDELSFDRMFADADRIHRLNIDHRVGGETNYYASVASPLAGRLAEDFPQTEMVTRFRNMDGIFLRKAGAKHNVKEEYVAGADSNFFAMFGLELIVGDTKTALKEPNTLVLTRTAAEKHFGINQALGQSLRLNDTDLYKVTGVMEDLPKNSFLRNHSTFLSIESFEDAHSVAWNQWIFPTFVKLLPSADIESFQAQLDSTVHDKYIVPWAQTFVPGLTVESSRADDKATGNFMKYNTIALTDIHLHSIDKKREFSSNSNIQNVYILSFIGFFLILLASVNFMNLSTAYALKRAKEVGIRKTLGSNRSGLIRQFLTEAGMISFLSFLAAVVIALLALPFFNRLADKAISIPLSSPAFWLTILGGVCLLGLFSGSYPAFFLSRFAPVKVLKGTGEGSLEGGKTRNVLVVFQFAISVFLIVCTLVIFQQLHFIQNKELGFQKDQILIVDDLESAGTKTASFKQEVEQLGQVESVSLSSYLPTPSARGARTFFPEGGVTQSGKALIYANWQIDHGYVNTLDLELIAGRNFDRQFTTDSNAVVLNESAVAMLGVKPDEALGMRITSDFHRPDKENMQFQTVIGVVRNFHFESLRSDIGALSLHLGDDPGKLIAKLNPGNFQSTVLNIEKIWERIAPGQPFRYYFMDDSFNDIYNAELRLAGIFVTFTLLSILIACLGLFGLAAFNAERRTKEIGIRKVLGASLGQITFGLSLNFLKLVGVAVLLAAPLGWYAMNQWLQDFSYRIQISWWVFVLAAFLAMAISIVTISYQGIKAGLANPVKSLRSE